MADEYNLRKDIDDLQRQLVDIKDDLSSKVSFRDENSTLQDLDDNTIDYIIEEWQQSSPSESDGGGSLGSFSIDANGHLIVTLPDGQANPYSIDENGHLIYDTEATEE